MGPLGDLSRVDGELIGSLQLQEKTTITSATSGAGGYRNHQPPHRPGLHLELATQGIERTKRSAGSPNGVIDREVLHSAGAGGKLRYSYPGHNRTPAVRTDRRMHEGHTPNFRECAPFVSAPVSMNWTILVPLSTMEAE